MWLALCWDDVAKLGAHHLSGCRLWPDKLLRPQVGSDPDTPSGVSHHGWHLAPVHNIIFIDMQTHQDFKFQQNLPRHGWPLEVCANMH